MQCELRPVAAQKTLLAGESVETIFFEVLYLIQKGSHEATFSMVLANSCNAWRLDRVKKGYGCLKLVVKTCLLLDLHHQQNKHNERSRHAPQMAMHATNALKPRMVLAGRLMVYSEWKREMPLLPQAADIRLP